MSGGVGTCARCAAPLHCSSMSFFNEDICCEDCIDDEKGAPGYGAARELELEAVRRKEFNFRGVGLGPDDRVFIAARIRARRDRCSNS